MTVAKLGFAIESAQAVTAKANLDNMTAAATKAELAQQRLAAASAGSNAALLKIAAGVDVANALLARLVAATDANTAASTRHVAAARQMETANVASAKTGGMVTAAQRQTALATDQTTAAIVRQNAAIVAQGVAHRARVAAGVDVWGRTAAEVAATRAMGGGAANQNRIAPIAIAAPAAAQVAEAATVTRVAGAGVGAVGALGGALSSLISPATAVSFILFSLGGAAVQYFSEWKKGAKELEKANKAHSDSLKLLKDQYGELGEAAKTAGNVGGLAFTGASARNAQALLQAQLREQQEPLMKTLTGGDGWGNLIPGRNTGAGAINRLQNLGGDQKMFSGPVDSLMKSVREGKGDLATFDEQIDDIFNKNLPQAANPTLLLATADAMKTLARGAFEVNGEFAAFADPINKLKLEGVKGIATFNAEVEKIGRNQGLQKQADKAIMAGKEFVALAEKAKELEKILQRIDREETRPGLSDRRALGGYVNRRAADLDALNSQSEAEQQMVRARTNAQRLAAIEAEVRARARQDGDKGGGLQARVDRALAEERNKQAVEERNANDDRHRAQLRSIEAAREEMSIIGATTGEAAKLRYEFSEIARLKEEAAKRGGIVSPEELARISETAVELGKIADAAARLNLNLDLDFERSQQFLSQSEQQIASRLRGTGLGANSPEAQKMRDMTEFQDAKDLANGFLSDFGSELMDSGGNIGKALGHSILNALTNSMSKQWEKIFDQLATAFASALTGQTAGGGASAAFGTASGFSDMIFGKASNDNYAPGAVTRAPLGALGGGSVAEQSWSFFKSKGLADHQVAGILGNIKAESAFNPSAVGDAGKAFGLFQHHGARGGGQGLMASGAAGQLDHAWNELNSSESGVLARLRASTDVKGATAAFAGFERPAGYSLANPEGAHNFTGRLSGAEQALDKFGGTASKATGSLGTLGDGMGKMGNALSQFPSAPGGGGGSGILGGLLGGLSSVFKGTKAFNWLSANPGGSIGLYADGTENAPPGWAWVGEEGPELRKLRAGDVIRSNPASIQMAANANRSQSQQPPKIDLHVTVVGGSGDDHVRMLAKQGAQEAIGQYNESQTRGGFGEMSRRFASQKG